MEGCSKTDRKYGKDERMLLADAVGKGFSHWKISVGILRFSRIIRSTPKSEGKVPYGSSLPRSPKLEMYSTIPHWGQ